VQDSPLSPLQATAAALHEWYVALREAGFTQDEAMAFIVRTVRANHGEGER
jgi:hypothetical protein